MAADNRFLKAPRVQRRVVVTGIGAITPLGKDVKSSWQTAINGQSGIGRVTQFDPAALASQIAGEASDFNPEEFVPKKDLKKMDRFIQMSLAATDEALQDCGLELTDEVKLSTGMYIGIGMGGLPVIQAQHKIFLERGPGRISPFFIPAVISNLASGQVSIKYGLKGPNFAITSACASGAHSIGEASRLVRDGVCDQMVAGGFESVICEMAMGGFSSMKAMSTRNESPETASRPYDKDRDGFVIAEGGAVVILEDYEKAARRGAKIYAEVAGYGASSDAFHMTGPEPGGDGAYRAMKAALNDAEIGPEQIDYINAHGTSTPLGDEIEVQAIRRLLGDAAADVWVSSTKSMTGHALGGAGSMESMFCLKALETGIVPPTINLDNPSEGCDLDFVPHTAREKSVKTVLNNSFGFGGTNACLIFSQAN